MSRPKSIPITLSLRDVERFLAKIPDLDAAGCKPWMGRIKSDGYGAFDAQGKSFCAHRVAWAVANGDPGDLHVLHRCDNPPCCNVGCLFLGTQADNNADMVSKGRHRSIQKRGSANPRAKLTDIQAEEIRRRYASGERQTSLAAVFGVNQQSISSIVLRRSYF